MSEFNTRFREIRKKLKLTLREMAQVLAIPLSTVSKYEQGVIKPGVEILSRVCIKYKVNINWLLTGAGEMFLENEDISKSNSHLKVNALKKDDSMEIVSVSDRFLINPAEYKNLSCEDYDDVMYKVAKKIDHFVSTEVTDEDGCESILIHYPDKHQETIEKNEVIRRDKLVDSIKHKLDSLYSDRVKLEYISKVINSMENKQSFEEIKSMLKDLDGTLV